MHFSLRSKFLAFPNTALPEEIQLCSYSPSDVYPVSESEVERTEQLDPPDSVFDTNTKL